MASNPGPNNKIVVTGDLTIDWNLARSRGAERNGAAWSPDLCSRATWQRGGAATLADLIAGISDQIRGEARYEVLQPDMARQDVGGNPVRPDDPRFPHAYASWLQYPFGRGKKHEKEKTAWRVHEFLGIDGCQPQTRQDGAKVAGDSADAQIVVLDDADLGFRNARSLWPLSITQPKGDPWIVLKMARPVAQGELWKHLYQQHSTKLIVLMTVNDLRLSEVQISRELSWERTAQDLAWEITYNPSVNSLAQCAHLVVSFDAAGAVLYSRDAAEDSSGWKLLFDPLVVEGEWEQKHEGGMIGYSWCLTAGIARELMLNPEKPNLADAVCRGLAGLRTLHQEGYGEREDAITVVQLNFPTKAVVATLAQGSEEFSEAEIPSRASGSYWTILNDHYEEGPASTARNIVLYGVESALGAVPIGKFGKLVTVDRQEIESFRSIRSLIGEYLAQARPKRPLSIAVFGPPGSGKSFGITELASALRPDEIERREFNLSQFTSTDELLSAFHQVRDSGLSGKVPLIFWDEFDCSRGQERYGWLRHFLAPMQDGKFQHGNLSHPIGKAIFVFAGGTSETLLGFGKCKATVGSATAHECEDMIRAAKLPDFVSRLKGYVNVLGPNQEKGDAGELLPSDKYYLLRRAVMLRVMFERDARQLIKDGKARVDSGVLRALLETRVYKHGARSMESILAMSQLAGETTFERSSLPAESQLELHVESRNFLTLVQRLELEGEVLDRLARGVHKLFCDDLRRKGFECGPVTQGKQHSNLKPFDELSAEVQEQNRAQVRDFPAKLEYAGCYMVPARSGEPPFAFSEQVLEELASLEHTRWIKAKVEAGWRYGPPPKNDDDRTHPCLLPWRKGEHPIPGPHDSLLGIEELPESEKDKDREAIRNIAAVLAEAGYTIVEGRRPNESATATAS